MKHLLYIVLLTWFFMAQAQDKVFNPIEKRAEICQQLEDVKRNFSCEGESCSPVYDSSVNLFLQWIAVGSCTFECVVGQRMCDTTLHPDNDGGGWAVHGVKSRCKDSSDENAFDVERSSYVDEEGVKRIYEVRTHKETRCEEYTEYVEVCSNDGDCREIEEYSDEWFADQKEQQLKEYEESCFIPTEDDCKKVEQEMLQCVSDAANLLSESICTPSTDNLLWKYRKHGVSFMGMDTKSHHDIEPTPPSSGGETP